MIAYRDATPADGPALNVMARIIWIETFGANVGPDDIRAYLEQAYGDDGQLVTELNSGAAQFYVATQGEAIIGYAKISPTWLPDADPNTLQLSQLYVASDWHGHGIAQVLMDWTIATARAQGAEALLLTVWEENHRAVRFYEKLGFVHAGKYAFKVGQQIDTDHIMRLAL